MTDRPPTGAPAVDRRRVDELLDRALDLPEPARIAFLDRECETPELRQMLARLLAASGHDATAPRVDGRLWEEVAAQFRPPVLAAGERLGAYRVVRELGRGGMALVYLAERADLQFEQRVALKILERPASDELAVRRFHLERQILATLEHPNIARLQDGGIAPDGRPYFVMELVEGLPIDRYCDREHLDLRARLELFTVVGRAVAAAHRQLVVHRDLKPSNILVSEEGVPKLLDFGIAKLLEGERSSPAGPALTRTAMRVLTPEYASPEQLAGRPISTASDIYQLGLLLYELLAGVRAFRFAGSTPSGLAEKPVTREPTRPSAAVATAVTAGEEQERARRRGCSSLRQLRKLLAGDLDTIVLAALRPEAERRYESVSLMVEDVERFLAGKPILARPDSLAYRTRKFVGRHRWAVAASAAALLTALGGMAYHTVELTAQRDRAEREALKAQQVSEFLVDLFRRPTDASGSRKATSMTVLELLDRGAADVETKLDSQPEVKGALLFSLARAYRALMQGDRAEVLLDQAIELQRRHLGAEAAETLDSLNERATVWHMTDRSAEALALFYEVLAGRERSLGPYHPKVAGCLYQISAVAHRLQRFEEAYTTGLRSLSILERQNPPDPQRLWRAHQAVAMALSSLRRDDETALKHHARTAELLRGLDPAHPQLGPVLSQYATALWEAGRLEEARPLFVESVRLMETVYGSDSVRTEIVRLNAADAEREAGNAPAALAMLDQSLPILKEKLVPSHFWLGLAHLYRGSALAAMGGTGEALAEVETGRAILTAAFGESSADVLRCDLEQAELLGRLQRADEARALLLSARTRAAASPDLAPELVAEIESKLGAIEGE